MRARMRRGTLSQISFSSIGILCLAFCSPRSSAEPAVRYYTENGVTYKETRSTVRRPVVERKMEQREKTVYREKVSTSYEPHTQLSYTPVTTYRWEGRWHDVLHLFKTPYVGYHLVPETQWQTRTEQVHRQVTRRDLVPEKQTYQVPVTTHRYVEEEVVHRMPVHGGGGHATTTVSGRGAIGGVHRIENDPPRYGSAWRGSSTRK
jgi:hypothetical protein